jgi:hypothetical protein
LPMLLCMCVCRCLGAFAQACVCACKHKRACACVCVCVCVCLCACVQVPFSVCVMLCSLAAHVLLPLYRDRADANRPGAHWIIDCLAAPSAEPSYPLAR